MTFKTSLRRLRVKSFHTITRSPSCHLTSQHCIRFISASCISAPTHQYSRLAKDCKLGASTIFTLFGTYFGYTHRIPSFLYTTHSHYLIITHIASIGPLEQRCELVWPLVIIYLTDNLLIPTPPAIQTSPSPYFCNKNSVKPTLFVSLALACKDPPVSKENKREREKREKVKQKAAKKIHSLRNIGNNQKDIIVSGIQHI